MKRSFFFTILVVALINSGQVIAQWWSYDTVSFEIPTDNIIIEPTPGNLWQIGDPDKVLFDAAFSGQKAIVTDTFNYYPVDNISSFIYVIRNPYTQDCITALEFWHKYDTDSLNDYGIIEASYDGGNSWLVVNDTMWVPPMSGYFFWEYDFHESTGMWEPHDLIISGRSDGWIKSSFTWQWWLAVDRDTIILNPDSLMVKFTFYSDSISELKEGWMIDELMISSGDGGGCGSTNDVDLEENVSAHPNPFSLYTVLKLKDALNEADVILFNSYGMKVSEMKRISGKEVTILRRGLPAGIYIALIIENNKQVGVKRLLISD